MNLIACMSELLAFLTNTFRLLEGEVAAFRQNLYHNS